MSARAVVAFVERAADGKLLCVWNKRYGGWGMPGGKVEDNETAVDALARELGEETGLSILGQPEKIWDAPHDTKPTAGVSGRGSQVLVFRVWTSGNPAEIEEGCAVTWLTRSEFLAWSPFAEFYRKMFAAVPPACCEYCDTNHRDIINSSSPSAPTFVEVKFQCGCMFRCDISLHGSYETRCPQHATVPETAGIPRPGQCCCRTLADGSDRVLCSGCPVHGDGYHNPSNPWWHVPETAGFREQNK